MSAAAVATTVRAVEPFDIALCAYSPTEWYVTAINDLVELEIGRSNTRPQVAESLIKLPTGPTIKLMAIGHPRDPSDLAVVAKRLALEAAGSVDSFYTYPEYLEIMPRGASKGEACREIRERLGVDVADVMAIGDGTNDVPMFDEARVRVAVANASPALAERADYIAPSNDEDGVAVAIDGLVFGEEGSLERLRARGMAGG
jgi:hydroxymethylpyrimidine pyrophosphatase-like HAD family hydrolase